MKDLSEEESEKLEELFKEIDNNEVQKEETNITDIEEEEVENLKYIQQVKLLEDFFETVIKTIPTPAPFLREIGEEIDIVISGGGTKGYYVVGAYAILHHLIKTEQIKVMRWAGASVGAASAVFMCCGVSPIDWVSTYWVTRKNIAVNKVSIAEGFRERAHALLPDDAHLLCNGKVFISVTRLGYTGPTNVILSQFESKEDLIEATVASLSIPFITSHKISHKFRGERFWDGGVTNNAPLFSDSHLFNRRQLFFHVSNAAYPANMSFQFNDTCIESLVARGILLMRQFVLNQLSKRAKEIKWYVPEKKDLVDDSNSSNTTNETRIGSVIRNSLKKFRSAPSLLVHTANRSSPNINDIHDDDDHSSDSSALSSANRLGITQFHNVKEFLDLNKRRILRATLLLLFTFCIFFLLSKQGRFAFGKSKMRIPLPSGLNFLHSIFHSRPVRLV